MKRLITLLLMVIVTTTITFGAGSPKKKSRKLQNCNKIGIQKVKPYHASKPTKQDSVNNYLSKEGYLPMKKSTSCKRVDEPNPKF